MKKILIVMAIIFATATTGSAFEDSDKVISPYFQSDADAYTFISVSHPSLFGSASQIGLRITSLYGGGAAVGNAYVEFTVSAGSTKRLFIVTTNSTTINAANYSTASFIATSTNPNHGQLVIIPSATTPGAVVTPSDGNGHRRLQNLQLWGAIIIPSSNSAWSMDFIGDSSNSINSKN